MTKTLKFCKVTSGLYSAQDDTLRYDVAKSDKGDWVLAITQTVETAGVRHILGQPTTECYRDDTRAACYAVAQAYSALGDEYDEAANQYRSRFSAAIDAAYATA